MRRALPQKALLLGKIRRYEERYGFLGKMLQVLDDEPIVIVHPSTRRAWRARIGGVADNFQLHTLLRAALAGEGPDRIRGAQPARAIVGAATSERTDGKLTDASDWQLANWAAILPDGSIAGQRDTDHWIWNEGFPAEIEPFEGVRLIAIGPSTIHRSWNAQRIFAGMRGWLTVDAMMPSNEANALFERMVRARGA